MDKNCHVCGRPLDDVYYVTCSACGRNIHFEPTDVPGRSCALLITQLHACGLSFVCNPCLERRASKVDGNS